MTINNMWAYNAHDSNFKSPKELIRALVEVQQPGWQLSPERWATIGWLHSG